MSSHSSNYAHGNSSGFPLRTNFFRSLPLTKRKNDKLYKLAKKNATACLNQSFNDQWRYIPPEKDGTQIRKDTSNLASSFRLVRAATVLRCQEHELNQVISNTQTESWREFMRKCFGKHYVDSIILHTVQVPNMATKEEDESEHASSSGSDVTIPKTHHADSENISSNLAGEDSVELIERQPSRYQASDERSECRSSETGSVETSKGNGGSQLDEHELAHNDDGRAEELLTVKWGAFDTGATGKRDLCLVDYLSVAYVPNTEHQEHVHLWCFTSAEGERVGCMELKDTHGLTRTHLTKFGVFWRRLSEEETEVIMCGSFPSKHAQMVSSIFLSCLNRLQGIVEDLRMSSQLYIHRTTWVKDTERTNCHLCMRHFYTLRRKHHCRKCGEVICSDCSTVETIDLPVIGYSKLRLCKVCCIRARSTPLKRLEKSNMFDRFVRARSFSNLNGGSSFARSSYTDNPESSSSQIALESSIQASGNQDMARRTHSSSSFSSSSNTTEIDPEHLDPNARALPAELNDFIDERTLKSRMLPASASLRAGSNSNMFDLLCELACQTLNCPIASVSILDAAGDCVRSATGLDKSPQLDEELCIFVDKVMGSTPTIVLDANIDSEVRSYFPRRDQPQIRYFAGCPIYSRAGKRLGYVCVADTAKRDSLGASYAFTMERLATLAVTTMERSATHSISQEAGNGSMVFDRNGLRPSTEAPSTELSKSDSMLARGYEMLNDMPGQLAAMDASTASAPQMRYQADYNAAYYEAHERMRKLLLKSYHTQQQLATGQQTSTPAPPQTSGEY